MNTNSVDFFENKTKMTFPSDCKITLAVWEIINPENVGRIIRLAHNINAKKVLFVNKEVNFRHSKIKKTAGFSYEQMAWEFITHQQFDTELEKGNDLVVLETCDGAQNIFTQKLPSRIILLAGSESHGIPTEIIKKSDMQTYIPMPGACKSMNVSHALSVASFEWFRQQNL